MQQEKVIVGISGGVDSAVAAYLLKEQNFDVSGVMLETFNKEKNSSEKEDAQKVADTLSIPFYTLNVTNEFKKCVINPFISNYTRGMTPNPCVICNHSVKWAGLLKFADEMNAKFIATGHYAQVKKLNDRWTIGAAKDKLKDQSYMLVNLSQNDLSRTIFPLGIFTKFEIRDIAKKIGLSVADKADSEDICFIDNGHYAEFIENNAEKIPPKGKFIDTSGNILGSHKGIIHYTVGQRKGLGVAAGHPVYVKKICANTNEIIIAENDELFSNEIICKDLNFMGIAPLNENESITATVKIRYRHAGTKAKITKNGETCKITFEEKVRAATPGQTAVFYDDNGFILGGGIIIDVI